ncbi:MAG TPA: acyl-CoA dehydrogenase family protein [Marmoricola sp.]
MDFDIPAEATEAAELAATIFADNCTQERLRAAEADGDRFDADLWHTLGEAGLIGLPLPDSAGGAGLGVLEATAVLIEAGKKIAPVPLAHHQVAAMALAQFGGADNADLLARSATGGVILTVAGPADRSGVHSVVPAATKAAAILVPVETEGQISVVVVTPDAPGVSIEPQQLSDGELAGRISITDPSALPTLGGADVAVWLDEHLRVAITAYQLGVVDGALALTSGYARKREQFGRAIGTFQAVSQRLADGYIDVLGARLMLWQAAWRLSEGLPAATEVAGAALWAADAGHRLAHTTVHVHGGVGIDLDGEAHRYFTAAKRNEFLLGGTTAQARLIGAALAS